MLEIVFLLLLHAARSWRRSEDPRIAQTLSILGKKPGSLQRSYAHLSLDKLPRHSAARSYQVCLTIARFSDHHRRNRGSALSPVVGRRACLVTGCCQIV